MASTISSIPYFCTVDSIFSRSPTMRDSHQQCAPFGGIVVNDAHDLIFRVRAVLKFTDDHGSRGAAADEHGASARALLGSGALIAQQTVDKAREARGRDEQHQNVNKRIAARHGQSPRAACRSHTAAPEHAEASAMRTSSCIPANSHRLL